MGYQRIASPRTGRAVILRDDHWKVIEQEAERMGLSVDAAIENAIRLYQAANHQAGEPFSLTPRHHIEPLAAPIPDTRRFCPGCSHPECLRTCQATRLLTQRIPR